jgi:hypothetical protein
MPSSKASPLIPELVQRPTSVFLHGSSRPLLNWVMYSLLDRSHPDFRWTDVRLRDERLDPLDPLARHVVPESRLSVIEPIELQPSPDPSASFSRVIRPDESVESVRRTLDFLRLPSHTQDMISQVSTANPPAQFALSNAHRLVGLFPSSTIRPTIQGILDSGVSLVMTWADASPRESRTFEFVIGVEGLGPASWKDAVLQCEIGRSTGAIRAGARLGLANLEPIAEILGPMGLSKA